MPPFHISFCDCGYFIQVEDTKSKRSRFITDKRNYDTLRDHDPLQLRNHLPHTLLAEFCNFLFSLGDVLLTPGLIIDLSDIFRFWLQICHVDWTYRNVRRVPDPVRNSNHPLRDRYSETALVAPVIMQLLRIGVFQQFLIIGRVVIHTIDRRLLKVFDQKAPVLHIFTKVDRSSQRSVSSFFMPFTRETDDLISNSLIIPHFNETQASYPFSVN